MFWNKKEAPPIGKEERLKIKWHTNIVGSRSNDPEVYSRLVSLFATRPFRQIRDKMAYLSLSYNVSKERWVFTEENPSLVVERSSMLMSSYVGATYRLSISKYVSDGEYGPELASLSFTSEASEKKAENELFATIAFRLNVIAEEEKAKKKAECLALMDEVLS